MSAFCLINEYTYNIHTVTVIAITITISRSFFAAEFTKNTRQTMIWKAERVGVVTMTKNVISFFDEKTRVTPSVTAPGDTNLSDATED